MKKSVFFGLTCGFLGVFCCIFSTFIFFFSFMHVDYSHEKSFFAKNDIALKAIVELAERNKLEHSGICESSIAFEVPSSYKAILKDVRCVYYDKAISTVFRVSPSNNEFFLVFFKDTRDLKDNMTCSRDGRALEQLDDNWFICQRELL
jgi:hypothetical protein